MRAVIHPHQFTGTYRIPASKSHTIRRLLFATLAQGVSVLEYPLDSLDARSCVAICRAFGAHIEEVRESAEEARRSGNPNAPAPDGSRLARWIVTGVGKDPSGQPNLKTPEDVLNVGNSGTTLYLALAVAGLHGGISIFTGDHQIRRRSAQNLLVALEGLGVRAESSRNNGCAPIIIQGPWKGGRVSIACPTSQYLSALLIAAPLAAPGTITELEVPLLNEQPYVEMTLAYLDAQGVHYEAAPDRSFFRIWGGASYKPMGGIVPGDFSSAAFPACAAAISGGTVTLLGLDPTDTQGDKALFEYLALMGCQVSWNQQVDGWSLTIAAPKELRGQTLDLNATPDALPVMAATACFAKGTTKLINVPNARIKETDRIAVMAQELGKLGAHITEQVDGLVIEGGQPLRGTEVQGHDDHRVVMALAVAGLACQGATTVDSAEAAAVTYPGFLELLGADMIE
ncbi:3-phosphoshikimate 1-carboxyvinyltransferase [Gracilinema caldarium]|nr:3-phosphoshikimate 1-carboxyvinyltransferase [Gracilinema caldarium]